MTKKLIISIFVMAFLLMNCEKDPSSSKDENNVPKLNGAFILNEGNFGGSNGSISFYSMEDKKVDNGIFNTINGKCSFPFAACTFTFVVCLNASATCTCSFATCTFAFAVCTCPFAVCTNTFAT